MLTSFQIRYSNYIINSAKIQAVSYSDTYLAPKNRKTPYKSRLPDKNKHRFYDTTRYHNCGANFVGMHTRSAYCVKLVEYGRRVANKIRYAEHTSKPESDEKRRPRRRLDWSECIREAHIALSSSSTADE